MGVASSLEKTRERKGEGRNGDWDKKGVDGERFRVGG